LKSGTCANKGGRKEKNNKIKRSIDLPRSTEEKRKRGPRKKTREVEGSLATSKAMTLHEKREKVVPCPDYDSFNIKVEINRRVPY